MTLKDFRAKQGPLSGNVRVVGGPPRGTGVRPAKGPAITQSRDNQAAPDDANGKPAGRGACTASAPAADRKSDAVAAREKAQQTGRTPVKDVEQWSPRMVFDEAELQPIQELPNSGLEFVQAVNKVVQMVGIGKFLLTVDDVKVQQRVFEQLVDLAYGKSARATEDARPGKISGNVPR